MDLFAVILFLILYFVRLHDWVPFLGGLNVVKPAMALGAFGLMTREPRKPAWKFMNTPHEWAMLLYLLACIYFDPDWYGTVPNILPLAGFYFLTVYSLNTEAKLSKFFGWWCACIVFMSCVGALTVVGLDLTKADEVIVASMGRLALNTSLMDNPNALGHTAVTAMTLIYMMMVFRRDIGVRALAIPFFFAVGFCVFATQSKGAYISGAAAFSSALLVGRKLWVQVFVGIMLVAGGYAASALLPRMVDRDAMRRDEGVMGRLLAFESARTAYQTAPAGWKKFDAIVTWEGEEVSKATHSSYVQVGADLGPKGLFLYLSVFCLAGRSLLRYRTESDDLERCRRLIFALIIGFAVSGWMITRPYHAEYFLLMGAATAYHKLAIENLQGVLPEFGGESVLERTIPSPAKQTEPNSPSDGENADAIEDETATKRRFWNRYGVVDFGIAYAMLQFTVWCWDYIIENL